MASKIWTKEKNYLDKTSRILGFGILVIIIIAGSLSCKKSAEEEMAAIEAGPAIKEGVNTFEGVVRTAVGRYLYIPEIRGLDVVLQGQLSSADTDSLIGKEVKGEGDFSAERPSILVANSLEVKEPEGDWMNVFNRSEEFVVGDFIDSKEREEFQLLENFNHQRSQAWEGIEKAKVFGKLEKKIAGEGEEQSEIYNIVVLDEDGEETGRIIINNFTDFAFYYMKKLTLFDSFFFYVNIKNTVDWDIRRRTRELFHADVLFVGLF